MADGSVLAGGAILLIMSYGAAIAMSVGAFVNPGVYDGVMRPRIETCHDTTGGVSLIPVVGSLIAGIAHESCALAGEPVRIFEPAYTVAGIVSGGFQILGAAIVIGALAAPGWKVLWDDGQASLEVSVSAGPSRAGVGLRLEAF